MNPAITTAITTLIISLIGVGSAFLNQWVKTRFKPEQLDTAARLANIAVAAAEQWADGVKDDVTGETKYHYAADAVEKLAAKVGLKLSDAETSALIHAALINLRISLNGVKAEDAFNQGAAAAAEYFGQVGEPAS